MTDTQNIDGGSRPSRPIMDRLRGIPDPRKGNLLRHACHDLLFAALLCVMCGYDSYRAFARFAQFNLEWLRGRGCAFANGLPSRCAFRHLLVRLDPALLGECLKGIANDLRRKVPFEIVAVDGKAARRGKRRGGGTLTDGKGVEWTLTSDAMVGQIYYDGTDQIRIQASPSDWTVSGAAAVPEPTSGHLMLLGMAGLALRRRRA